MGGDAPVFVGCTVGAGHARPAAFLERVLTGRLRAAHVRPLRLYCLFTGANRTRARRGQDPSLRNVVHGRFVGSGLDRSGEVRGWRTAHGRLYIAANEQSPRGLRGLAVHGHEKLTLTSPSHTPRTHSARGTPLPNPPARPRHTRRAEHRRGRCPSSRRVSKSCA